MRIAIHDSGRAVIQAESWTESKELLTASMKPYGPRSAGIMPDDNRGLVLYAEEVDTFQNGVSCDPDLAGHTKWAIEQLLNGWKKGEITDEGFA